MTRKLSAMVLCLTMAVVPCARAETDVNTALAAVPADAIGFISLPSLKQLDGDLQQAVTNLGLESMVQPPMNSIVTLLKMQMPQLAGMDESKPVVFVVMPIQTMMDIWPNGAYVFSAADPKAMVEGLGGVAGEDGVWTINFMGRAQHAMIKDKQVILGLQSSIVKAVGESKSSITSKLPKSDLRAMNGLDLAIWIDGEKLFVPLKPTLNAFLAMATMQMQASGNPAAADQMREGLEDFIDGLNSMLIGLSVQNEGLGIRFGMTAKPNSEFAKNFNVATTEGSLLGGLPGAPYLVAGGTIANANQAKAFAGEVESMIEASAELEGVDQDKLEQLTGMLAEMASNFRGLRFSMQGLEPGPGGLFGVSAILNTTDAKRMLELEKKAVTIGKDLVKELLVESGEATDDEITPLLDAISYKTGTDKVGGAEVTEFSFDFSKIAEVADLGDEDLAMVKKVVGDEGLLFRAVVANEKTVIVGFGGGKERFSSLVAQAASNSAPLDADEGVKKLAASLPKKRAAALYANLDEIVKTVQNVQRAVGEEVLPVQVPKLNAPLAFSSTGGDLWAQHDIFVPTALIRAAKDASMAAAAPPPAPQPATSDEP